MRNMLIPLAIVLAGSTAAVASTPKEDPAARFARETRGLVPGKPVECLPLTRTQTRLTAAGDKLLYRVSRSLIYVNDTDGGCENVRRGDALVTTSNTGRLCRGDLARTVDLVARMPTGGCALGSFTPYTAPGK